MLSALGHAKALQKRNMTTYRVMSKHFGTPKELNHLEFVISLMVLSLLMLELFLQSPLPFPSPHTYSWRERERELLGSSVTCCMIVAHIFTILLKYPPKYWGNVYSRLLLRNKSLRQFKKLFWSLKLLLKTKNCTGGLWVYVLRSCFWASFGELCVKEGPIGNFQSPK